MSIEQEKKENIQNLLHSPAQFIACNWTAHAKVHNIYFQLITLTRKRLSLDGLINDT